MDSLELMFVLQTLLWIVVFVFLVMIGRKINVLRNNAGGQENSQERSRAKAPSEGGDGS